LPYFPPPVIEAERAGSAACAADGSRVSRMRTNAALP